MKIAIVGTGYVGSVTGVCLADMGHKIHFVDIDQAKLDRINSGQNPVFEPRLDDLLLKNHLRITTTTDIAKAVRLTDLTMICVGTPPNPDGSSDLRFIIDVAHSMGKALEKDKKYHTIIVKSTVIPGTTDNVVLPILEHESGKQAIKDFGIGSNPEFLKEGSAVHDFFHT